MLPLVSKTPTKKSFFSLMKGDIAQRSIRSSMSRMVDARLPRMISRVTGSTRGAGRPPAVTGVSATASLQHDIVGVVHAGAEPRSHQRRRVVLADDGRALEAHPRGQAAARVARGGDKARAPEVDRAPIDHGMARPGRVDTGCLASGQGPDGGDAEIDELDRRAGQIVGVEPAVLGVERRGQLGETGPRERALAEGARQLEALVLVAEVGRSLEALPARRDL